jgi:hypothetical protein
MPQLQFLGHRLVARQIRLVEIIQQTAALADHDQQATARAVVLDVLLEMFGEVVDALGQKSHLHIRRPGVLGVQLKARYRLAFFHKSISRSIKYSFKGG